MMSRAPNFLKAGLNAEYLLFVSFRVSDRDVRHPISFGHDETSEGVFCRERTFRSWLQQERYNASGVFKGRPLYAAHAGQRVS
jgi:hypothetical protein